MVNIHTVNSVGESFVVRKGPFKNITRFSSWSILTGMVIPNEILGTVNIAAGDAVVNGNGTRFTRYFREGSIIIINSNLFEVAIVNSDVHMELATAPEFSVESSSYYVPLDVDNVLSYEYRWSTDGVNFSEYEELNNLYEPGSFSYVKINPSDEVYVEIKATCDSIVTGNSLSVLDVEINGVEGESRGTEVDECTPISCDDPFSMEGGAVISVETNANTYNPYAATKAENLYKQLNNMVSDMFGHSVNYFRTEPDVRTKDVTLMEYSLHNVVANQNVKILVPDNEFPEEANTFDIFGMEFAEFEVHIVHDAFKKAFGDNTRPRSKDYMYIPIINKMYEISSVSIADEFNASRSYWRIKLVKYQDRSSVIKGDFELETDSLTTGIESVFGEEIKAEQDKVTKPVQYKTVSKLVEDGVRSYIDDNLKIASEQIVCDFATISQNHYNLAPVTLNSVALKYDSKSKVDANAGLSVVSWFRPKFKASDTGTYTIIGDGNSSGFRLKINTTDIISTTGNVNNTFNHNIVFSDAHWYALVFNLNNTFEQVGVTIYKLSNGTNGANELTEVYSGFNPLSNPISWSYDEEFNLVGGKLDITNIRVFNKPLDETEYINVLMQNVVRDNQHALVIDNAVPSLGYQKFKNAR